MSTGTSKSAARIMRIDLMARHVRQMQIHQDQVVFIQPQKIQCVPAGFGMLCPNALVTQSRQIVTSPSK